MTTYIYHFQHWSNELAIFAQRWADQCDPFLYPDKADDCRDLGKSYCNTYCTTIKYN